MAMDDSDADDSNGGAQDGNEMPERVAPPFDRDRYLPQANDAARTDAEDDEVM